MVVSTLPHAVGGGGLAHAQPPQPPQAPAPSPTPHAQAEAKKNVGDGSAASTPQYSSTSSKTTLCVETSAEPIRAPQRAQAA